MARVTSKNHGARPICVASSVGEFLSRNFATKLSRVRRQIETPFDFQEKKTKKNNSNSKRRGVCGNTMVNTLQ